MLDDATSEEATASNGTNPIAAAEQETEEVVDGTLRLVTRICALIVVLVLVGACVAYPMLKKKLVFLGDGRKTAGFRAHKVKQLLYNFCCCIYCCPSFHKRFGFEQLKPNINKMLRITLLTVANVNSRLDFYFEVWTEPAEGYPKNSRIHQHVVGSCDLGCEQLELDWVGDEEEFVIQAVKYSGGKQNKDLAIGELRVNRSSIEKYAKEAGSAQGDMQKGTRVFTMNGLDRDAQRARERRFKNPNPILPAVFTAIQEKEGFSVAEFSEVGKLREQNEALLNENFQLKTQMGTASGTRSKGVPSPMSVAIRFEICDKNVGVASGQMFRAPSFQEVPGAA